MRSKQAGRSGATPTIAAMRVEEYVAASDSEREAHLASLSPDELLNWGIELYNAGEYWHAHEAWEAAWLDAPNELRPFYQGLIQVAAAFVHVTRGEYPGSVRLLQAGIEKLETYPEDYLGVDIASLLDGARRARARLVELGERRLGEFDRGLIPRITRAVTKGEAS